MPTTQYFFTGASKEDYATGVLPQPSGIRALDGELVIEWVTLERSASVHFYNGEWWAERQRMGLHPDREPCRDVTHAFRKVGGWIAE